MPRKYFYRGEFGLLRMKQQPGLVLSDISDVSSDSEAPEGTRWRLPRPGAQARREYESLKPLDELDEEARKERNAMMSDVVSTILRRRARQRQLQRENTSLSNIGNGLLTPRSSPGPRSPSPAPPFRDVSRMPLTEREQLDFGNEAHRTVLNRSAKLAWLRRQDSRVVRRAVRDEQVRDRIIEWNSKCGRDSGRNIVQIRKWNPSYSSKLPTYLSPQELWRRREVLLGIDINEEDPCGWMHAESLKNLTITKFYEIFLTMKPKMQQYLLENDLYERTGSKWDDRHRGWMKHRDRQARQRAQRYWARQENKARDKTRSVTYGRVAKPTAKTHTNQKYRKVATKRLGTSILTIPVLRAQTLSFSTTSVMQKRSISNESTTMPFFDSPLLPNEFIQSQDEEDIRRAKSEEPAATSITSSPCLGFPEVPKLPNHLRSPRTRTTDELNLRSRLQSRNGVVLGARVEKKKPKKLSRLQTEGSSSAKLLSKV